MRSSSSTSGRYLGRWRWPWPRRSLYNSVIDGIRETTGTQLVCVRLTKTEVARLDEAARVKRQTRSGMLRLAIDLLLDGKKVRA